LYRKQIWFPLKGCCSG